MNLSHYFKTLRILSDGEEASFIDIFHLGALIQATDIYTCGPEKYYVLFEVFPFYNTSIIIYVE